MRHLNVVVYSPQLKPIHFYLTPRYIIYDYCNCMEYHFSLYKEHSFTFFFNSSIHFRQNMMGMNKLLMSSHQDMGRYLKISLPITLATIIVIHNFIPVTIEIYIKLLYWHYTWPLKKKNIVQRWVWKLEVLNTFTQFNPNKYIFCKGYHVSHGDMVLVFWDDWKDVGSILVIIHNNLEIYKGVYTSNSCNNFIYIYSRCYLWLWYCDVPSSSGSRLYSLSGRCCCEEVRTHQGWEARP